MAGRLRFTMDTSSCTTKYPSEAAAMRSATFQVRFAGAAQTPEFAVVVLGSCIEVLNSRAEPPLNDSDVRTRANGSSLDVALAALERDVSRARCVGAPR
jgi:hypothetical protein